MKLIEYTLVQWGNEPTHLVEPYSRTTLCGIDKKHKPTVWHHRANGTGCQTCRVVALAMLTDAFAAEVGKFDAFVYGREAAA